jgi:hypothetical protein
VKLLDSSLEVGVTLDELVVKMSSLYGYKSCKPILSYNSKPYTYRDNRKSNKIGIFIEEQEAPIPLDDIIEGY